jgi:hypothetical protein
MTADPRGGEERVWRPIESAPRDGTGVIVAVDVATVLIVRNATWDDGDQWDMQGFDSQEEARGWWFNDNSVSQSKMEGYMEPTHWLCVVPGFPHGE